MRRDIDERLAKALGEERKRRYDHFRHRLYVIDVILLAGLLYLLDTTHRALAVGWAAVTGGVITAAQSVFLDRLLRNRGVVSSALANGLFGAVLFGVVVALIAYR